MLAQELAGEGVEEAHVELIPLDVDLPADPAGRGTVVGGLDLDAAVQVHGALAILVIAERLDGQGQESRFSSANMAATCRLVVPWMRVSAQCVSQRSR